MARSTKDTEALIFFLGRDGERYVVEPKRPGEPMPEMAGMTGPWSVWVTGQVEAAEAQEVHVAYADPGEGHQMATRVAGGVGKALGTAVILERISGRLSLPVEELMGSLQDGVRISERLGLSFPHLMASLREVADRGPAGSDAPAGQVSEHDEAVLREVGLLDPDRLDRPASVTTAIAWVKLRESSLTPKEAAKLLGVSPTRVRQRLGERSLYGFTVGSTWHLPRFQFDPSGGEVPGLAQIVPRLPADAHPLAVVGFFTHVDPDLSFDGEAMSPREWLAGGGDVGKVAELATTLRPAP